MRQVPVQIATPDSSTNVTEEVRRLLRAAGVKDELPTPKERILACQRLVETGELDLAEYEATLAETARDFFHRAASKIIGIFDRRTQIIYVDPHTHDSRKLFVTYHEVTHSILGWQHIDLTQEDDKTLRPDCEELFEAEANYGAADILFQCERFESEARDYEVSLESTFHLADRYNSSRHAALRRFVERSNRPCALLVLTPTQREYSDGQKSYYVVYCIRSDSFIAEFGDELDLIFINPSHDIGKVLNNGQDGEAVLSDSRGFQRRCAVQVFYNSYKTFAMVYPRQTSRSRKIVRFTI